MDGARPEETPRPVISVVVPTRNRVGVLKRALDSIARQSSKNFEVIVVDDGSTPENLSALGVLEREYDSRFSFLRRGSDGVSHGPDFARNAGVAQARGRYVTFLDDDDYWCDDEHIEKASRCLEAHPEIDMFVANQVAVRGDDVTVPNWLPELEKRILFRPCISTPDIYRIERADLLRAGGIGFAHVNISIVRRELVLGIEGFWGDAPYEGDLNFFLRSIDRGEAFAHRAAIVSVNTVRSTEDSFGVSSISNHSKLRLRMAHCHHALLRCSRREVRGYARQLLSHCLKTLARQHYEQGDWRRAAEFSAQAVAVEPSLRWWLIALYTRLRTLTLVLTGGRPAGA